MKKIVFIIPYFGKWPSYFSMWLKSIKANPTIDFLIITDLEIGVGLSENIKILNWTFSIINYVITNRFMDLFFKNMYNSMISGVIVI